MKTLVVYYSKTGNNKYLAGKVSHALKGDIEEIKPRLNFFPFLILFSLIKISPGVKALKLKVNGYDRIIVCGPIWMGQLISPLRDLINKYLKNISRLYFISCCGSSDAGKDNKFGYARVFQHVKSMAGDKCSDCEALPIGLVLPDGLKEDSNAVMNTRLSDNNFTGQIQKRFEDFIQKVTL